MGEEFRLLSVAEGTWSEGFQYAFPASLESGPLLSSQALVASNSENSTEQRGFFISGRRSLMNVGSAHDGFLVAFSPGNSSTTLHPQFFSEALAINREGDLQVRVGFVAGLTLAKIFLLLVLARVLRVRVPVEFMGLLACAFLYFLSEMGVFLSWSFIPLIVRTIFHNMAAFGGVVSFLWFCWKFVGRQAKMSPFLKGLGWTALGAFLAFQFSGVWRGLGTSLIILSVILTTAGFLLMQASREQRARQVLWASLPFCLPALLLILTFLGALPQGQWALDSLMAGWLLSGMGYFFVVLRDEKRLYDESRDALLTTLLEFERHKQEQAELRLRAVTAVAAEVSDKFNSPLLVLENICEKLQRSPSEPGHGERLERSVGLMTQSLKTLRALSGRLAEYRESHPELEATALLMERPGKNP